MQAHDTPAFTLSCAEFARLNQVLPQSVRVRLCKTGRYFGIVPKKLANGRLAFPPVQIERGARA